VRSGGCLMVHRQKADKEELSVSFVAFFVRHTETAKPQLPPADSATTSGLPQTCVGAYVRRKHRFTRGGSWGILKAPPGMPLSDA
jgi:hypothetical protein